VLTFVHIQRSHLLGRSLYGRPFITTRQNLLIIDFSYLFYRGELKVPKKKPIVYP